MDVVKSSQKRMHLIQNRNDYTYELDGKLYKVMEVDGVFKQNPDTDQNTVYDIIKANLQEVGAIPTEDKELKVESVSAINAVTVEVKFNKAVDADTVLTDPKDKDSELVDGVVTFKSLDEKEVENVKGKLSKDGKVLTITAQDGKIFEGRYDVTIDSIKDLDGNLIAKYEVKNLDLGKDKTAPTVLGTERVSSNKVKVKFSEPVKFAEGAISAKYVDAKLSLGEEDVKVGDDALTALNAEDTAPVTELVFSLSNDVKVNKDIVVTFNGVADMAGNLISPQPSTVTIVKKQADEIEPAIASITQTGAKTFTIKFNKDLDGKLVNKENEAYNITVDTYTVKGIKKLSASEYEVTVGENLNGLQTVTVKEGKAVDLAGQSNKKALTKVVTFKEDVAAPKATAKLVVNKDNKEVIELTFDKDVKASNVTIKGSYVKDYITTELNEEGVTATAVYADGKEGKVSKKVLHVPLAINESADKNLAVKGAKYNLTLTGIKSASGVEMEEVKVSFTRGEDGDAANIDVVTKVEVAQGETNDKVKVIFTIPNGAKLDGATATDVTNYSIAGAEIESVNLDKANGTTQVATLNLKKDSNTFTGVRNITVKNVKIAGSTKVMEPVTINDNTTNLNENVRPTVEKAELTANNEITLTFSENVTVTANAFEIFIGDSKEAVDGTSVAEVTAEAKTNKAVIKLATAAEGGTEKSTFTPEDIKAGITVKLADGDNVKVEDTAGNPLNFKSIKVTVE
ncbi:hypothetical protein HF847_11465 [Clostridium cochlearium]|uniref:hypothetical protein n=1 Tax=Clostridium cochlearium TaxID=1494 RepID=UPI00145928EF|nr:hypothetical protein [Clostridium cochlearium]NME96589.1 hypothetical protein [Clostridium cochlearium]